MTKKEVSKLLAVLAAAYPRFESDELKVTVWHEMLNDIDYQVAQLAVKKCILEFVFSPSIAEVRQAAIRIMSPQEITAAEAWGEVEKAIKDHGYYSESQAIGSMSPLTARVVQYLGWREICLSTEPGVIRGQFLKMYGQVEKRESEQMILPAEVKNKIQMIGQKHLKAIES